MARKFPPLGETQKAFLKALVRYGSWTTGGVCGWTWSNESETRRLAESLRKRGLAMRTQIDASASSDQMCTCGGTFKYTPTQLGIDAARVKNDPYGKQRKKLDEIAAGKGLPKPDWKAHWLSFTDEQRQRVVNGILDDAVHGDVLRRDGLDKPGLMNVDLVAAKLLEAIGRGEA